MSRILDPSVLMTMNFRRITDIRVSALMIGMTAILWAYVPLADYSDRTLFAKVLLESETENWWIATLLTVGMLLVYGSLIKNRSALFLGESLGAITFMAMWIMFVPEASVAPMVLTMPMYSVLCLCLLAREVVFGCRSSELKEKLIIQGRHEFRGISDMRDGA